MAEQVDILAAQLAAASPGAVAQADQEIARLEQAATDPPPEPAASLRSDL